MIAPAPGCISPHLRSRLSYKRSKPVFLGSSLVFSPRRIYLRFSLGTDWQYRTSIESILPQLWFEQGRTHGH